MEIEADPQKRPPEVTSPPRGRKKIRQQREEQLTLGDDKPQVNASPKATAKAEPDQHGTKKDTSRSRAYWRRKNIAYLVDQLGLLGVRIDPSQLTGKEEVFDVVKNKKVKQNVKKITRAELLQILFEK